MKLELEQSGSLIDPGPADIERAILLLNPTESGYIILSRDEMTYLQAAGCRNEGFAVEYQDGNTFRHFLARGGPVATNDLIKALQSYASGDDAWRRMFEWEPMTINSGRAGCATSLLLFAASAALACLGLGLWL